MKEVQERKMYYYFEIKETESGLDDSGKLIITEYMITNIGHAEIIKIISKNEVICSAWDRPLFSVNASNLIECCIEFKMKDSVGFYVKELMKRCENVTMSDKVLEYIKLQDEKINLNG